MLKVSKPKRFAKVVKVNHQSVQTDSYMKFLKKKNKPKQKELPKNTLKVEFLKHELGFDKDDFMFDRRTLRSQYNIYTFKRN